jgi:hypothetical protein
MCFVLIDRETELGELLGVFNRDGTGRSSRAIRVLVLVTEVGKYDDYVVGVRFARQ